jgi:predicted nucleic acid-binding protein
MKQVGARSKAIRDIYMDVCALCRPYDDQSTMLIRLETDAVFLILEAVRKRSYRLMVSPVHFREMGSIEDIGERTEINAFLRSFGLEASIEDSKEARRKTEELRAKHLGIADAAHLVYARASADCLISCDDRFVKRGQRACPDFFILGPVEFCEKEKLR